MLYLVAQFTYNVNYFIYSMQYLPHSNNCCKSGIIHTFLMHVGEHFPYNSLSKVTKLRQSIISCIACSVIFPL